MAGVWPELYHSQNSAFNVSFSKMEIFGYYSFIMTISVPISVCGPDCFYSHEIKCPAMTPQEGPRIAVVVSWYHVRPLSTGS